MRKSIFKEGMRWLTEMGGSMDSKVGGKEELKTAGGEGGPRDKNTTSERANQSIGSDYGNHGQYYAPGACCSKAMPVPADQARYISRI